MEKNKIAIILISASILAAAGTNCTNAEKSKSRNPYAIIAKGYSAMRIDPMIFSGIITYLNKGESVEVLERSREKSWVGKGNDFWYRVKTKDGTTGWVFGQTIAIQTSSDRTDMEKVVSEFMELETIQIKKNISGKWWSTNEFGDFTDHCLDIYESGEYRSYLKDEESKAITGTYKINLNKNEIVFSKGTSFKGGIELIKRANNYVLKKNVKDRDLRFSKISLELPPKPNIEEDNSKKPRASKNGNPAK